MKHVGIFFLFLTLAIGVLARAAHADIQFNLENPSPGQTVSGITIISGWAFSTTPDAKVTVTVTIDNGQPFTIPCCVDRADVAGKFPDQPQALNSGFGQTFNYNLLTDGTHKITITVKDDQNASASSPEQSFSVVRPGGFEVLSLLDILLANNLEVINKDNIAEQQIVMEDVRAIQKDTNISQDVKIYLAWQESTQSLGIVKSDNVGSETGAQVAQAGQSGSEQTQAVPGGQIQSNETDPITVTLENPAAQTTTGTTGTASGIGLVSGWAVSATTGATISSVQRRVDGTVPDTNSFVPCCSQRADVQRAFKDQPTALNSGFGALVNFNLLKTGGQTIGVEVKDSTGATVTADNQVTVVRIGDSEFIDQFDLSDTFISTSSQTLILDGVNVRDKFTQTVTEGLLVHFSWQPGCQCFVAQAICGNGSVEPTEECDETAFADETCSSLGYNGGTLKCTDFCQYDTSECTGGPQVYVTNLADDTVSILDTATNELDNKTIKVGDEPRGLVISPDGALAYVANFRSDTVSVIDTAAKTVTATIQLQEGKGEKGPQGLAISCDGTRLYTVNGFDDSVSVVDTSTKSVIANVAVGHRPQRIALTPDGTRAYVTNNNQNSVSVIDVTVNPPVTIGDPIPVGQTPDGIAVSPDGKRVYVANFNFDNKEGQDTVSIIDTTTNTAIKELLAIGFHPVRIAFSQDGTRAYVSSNAAGTIAVIDTATESVINELLTQDLPLGLVVTNRAKRLYVALFGNNASGSEVEVTSAVTGGTVGLVSVGDGPFEIALVPPVNFCTP